MKYKLSSILVIILDLLLLPCTVFVAYSLNNPNMIILYFVCIVGSLALWKFALFKKHIREPEANSSFAIKMDKFNDGIILIIGKYAMPLFYIFLLIAISDKENIPFFW